VGAKLPVSLPPTPLQVCLDRSLLTSFINKADKGLTRAVMFMWHKPQKYLAVASSGSRPPAGRAAEPYYKLLCLAARPAAAHGPRVKVHTSL
jgi:hypothetical protein